jgi:pyrimidine operon attenuation protein/uracil phosphoribosyltransferase
VEKKQLLANEKKFSLIIERLALELIENHGDFSDTVIIGLQPRGIFVSARIIETLKKILTINSIASGNLDITFFRDDFRTHDTPLIPSKTEMEIEIENKKVVLVDDVLFTGRTIRSGIDALLSYGRLYSRDLPIQANYSGLKIDTINSEKVIVNWKQIEQEDSIWLMQKN